MQSPLLRVTLAALPMLILGMLLVVLLEPAAVTAGPVPMVGWTPLVESTHLMIPAFSRKYDMECTECHTAWPSLNAFGREFKLDGYKLPGEREELDDEAHVLIAEDLTLDRKIPITVRGIMRPFDQKKGKDAKIRAFHEVEIMIGASLGKQFSGWVEIEAEDEDEFNVFVEQGVFAYNPAPEANIAMGWAPVFWTDPFNSLADGGRRMTRSHKGPLDLRFRSRERLRSSSQWVSFYGRAADSRVTYLGGISAGGEDPEGGEAKDGFGRVMVDVYGGVYLGGFVLSGTNESTGTALGFTRTGFDFQVEQGGFNAYGLVMYANDDVLEGGTDDITTAYVETFYTIPVKLKAMSMLVPLVRIDYLDEFTNLTANMNFYLTQNVKTYFEWWQNIATPSGVNSEWRATVQLDFAF